MEFTISVDNPATILGLERAATASNKTVEEVVQEITSLAFVRTAGAHINERISPFDFLNRFTPEERAAIRAAAMTNGQIADYIGMVSAAPSIVLTDELTVTGVNHLEAASLLAPGRGAEILAL
jgi:hypothetical protein